MNKENKIVEIDGKSFELVPNIVHRIEDMGVTAKPNGYLLKPVEKETIKAEKYALDKYRTGECYDIGDVKLPDGVNILIKPISREDCGEYIRSESCISEPIISEVMSRLEELGLIES